jgi:DNA-binding NarL/FixJ family response regulator
LTALKLNLTALELSDLGAQPQVKVASQLATELLDDIRGVVAQIRQHDGLDLRQALTQLIAPLPTPRIHLSVAEDARVDSVAQAETLLRIVQEALTNIVRHAHADNAWIDLRREGNVVRLSGPRRWPRRIVPLREGFGLKGMRETHRRRGRHARGFAGQWWRRGARHHGAHFLMAVSASPLPMTRPWCARDSSSCCAASTSRSQWKPLTAASSSTSSRRRRSMWIVSDVRMPALSGIEALRALRARGDRTPMILLTTFDDSAVLLEAVEAGAQGFLLKDAAPEDLRQGILQVRRGESLAATRRDGSRARALRLPRNFRTEGALHRTRSRHPAAARRRLLQQGIGRSLHLAEGTVKNYVSDILEKLDTRDRTRAVLKAITLRII